MARLAPMHILGLCVVHLAPVYAGCLRTATSDPVEARLARSPSTDSLDARKVRFPCDSGHARHCDGRPLNVAIHPRMTVGA